MAEKTELEKRWEQELDGEELLERADTVLDNLNEKLDESGGEELVDFMSKEFINNPFAGISEFLPMCITNDGTMYYLGGFAGFSGGGITIEYPMMYREMIQNTPQGMQVQLGINKALLVPDCVDSMWIRHNLLYMLKSSHPSDIRLVKSYEEAVIQMRSSMSGIVAPTDQDFEMLRKSQGF